MRKGQVEILLKKVGCKDIKINCPTKIKLHPVAAFFATFWDFLPLWWVKPIDWKGVGISGLLFASIFTTALFAQISTALGVIVLCASLTLNLLHNKNYFSKYIQKKLREGYQVEDQEQRQILEEAGLLPRGSSYQQKSQQQSVAPSSTQEDPIVQLDRLSTLVEKGLLSKEEFELQKKKLLGH